MNGDADKYECKHLDRSVLRGTFDRIFCEPILKRLPRGITPNHITLLGGVGVLLSDLFIYLGIGGNRYCFLAAALFLFLYTICDDLDGLHAKRNGLTSKRGEFFDHWLDSIVAANNITIAVILMGLYGILLPLLAFSVFFAFHLPVWGQKETDVFVLTAVGPLEGLIFNTIFYVLAFFLYGSSIFTFREGALNLVFVFTIFAIASFFFSCLAPLRVARSSFASLILPLAYSIVFCAAIYFAENDIYILFVSFLIVNVVLSGSIQSVRLSQRKRKARVLFNYILLPLSLLIILPAVNNQVSAMALNGIFLCAGVLMLSDAVFALKYLPGPQRKE